MRLPDELKDAIESVTARRPLREIAAAAAEISDAYRKEGGLRGRTLRTDADRLAYLAVRMPATFAAVSTALDALEARCPEIDVRSVLDLGAGPGTAAWAAMDRFPEIERTTLVERDAEMVHLGKELASFAPGLASSAEWRVEDLRSVETPAHDLVLLAYAIGELPPVDGNRLVVHAWEQTAEALVVVEPGTTRGFSHVRAIRSLLVEMGATIVAPCPHQMACPMPPGDWCHFAVRIERSALHRRVKGGSLGYEDEKFSYVIATRTACPPARARILRHPRKRPGHVILDLCTPDGLQRSVIGKSRRDVYKRARHADWGDEWDEST